MGNITNTIYREGLRLSHGTKTRARTMCSMYTDSAFCYSICVAVLLLLFMLLLLLLLLKALLLMSLSLLLLLLLSAWVCVQGAVLACGAASSCDGYSHGYPSGLPLLQVAHPQPAALPPS